MSEGPFGSKFSAADIEKIDKFRELLNEKVILGSRAISDQMYALSQNSADANAHLLVALNGEVQEKFKLLTGTVQEMLQHGQLEEMVSFSGDNGKIDLPNQISLLVMHTAGGVSVKFMRNSSKRSCEVQSIKFAAVYDVLPSLFNQSFVSAAASAAKLRLEAESYYGYFSELKELIADASTGYNALIAATIVPVAPLKSGKKKLPVVTSPVRNEPAKRAAGMPNKTSLSHGGSAYII